MTKGYWKRGRSGAALATLVAGALSTHAGMLRGQEPTGDPAPVPEEVAYSGPSARGALIRSLLLPGLGQAYVGANARGALYFGLEAVSLWMVYKSSRSLAAAKVNEEFLRERELLTEESRLPLARSRAQQVEDWITLSVFWALFAGADAYVAAQLLDFGEHLGVSPSADGAVRFEAHLPLGRRR